MAVAKSYSARISQNQFKDIIVSVVYHSVVQSTSFCPCPSCDVIDTGALSYQQSANRKPVQSLAVDKDRLPGFVVNQGVDVSTRV